MPKQTLYDKLNLLGVDIDAVSNTGAIEYIAHRATPGQPSCYVVKPYVEFLDRAYQNKPLQNLLNDAELAIPDGIALVWAAAYLYAGPHTPWRFWVTLFQIILAPHELQWPLTTRAAGTNFTWPLLEAAASQKLRVYLIGSPADGRNIAAVARLIEQKLPSITIAGVQSGRDHTAAPGQVSDAWLSAAADAVRTAKADIILVGMGFPLQEKVCAYLAKHVSHGVFIGEGGTFDYDSFGGSQRKAPSWMQRIGLEWLWRLILQPQRIKRQLAIPRFIWRIWKFR